MCHILKNHALYIDAFWNFEHHKLYPRIAISPFAHDINDEPKEKKPSCFDLKTLQELKILNFRNHIAWGA